MTTKSKRGFAAMRTETQRAIASKGGKTAHEMGLAHEFNPVTAQAAGRKAWEKKPQTSERMAEIGRLGALARHKKGKDKGK